MNQAAVTRSILRSYRSADAVTHAAGSEWYPAALSMVTALSAGTPYDIHSCARVVAVLSPSVTWEQNLALARNCLQVHAHGGAPGSVLAYRPANVLRAFRILDGEQVTLGPKTGAFCDAILGDAGAIVLDRWAIRAGIPAFTGERDLLADERRTLLAAYRSAARIAGVSPRTMQAVVWCALRGKVN